MDANWTYCGGHFTISKNFESLHCTPETSKMLYVNYISTLKNKCESGGKG